MKEQPSLWYQTRNAHKKTFVALADYIIEEVINRKEILFVADLSRFYAELVNDLINDGSDVSYNARKLEGKIMNCFGDRIQLVRAKTIRGNVICDKKYTTKEAIRLSDKQNIQTKIRDVALFEGEKFCKLITHLYVTLYLWKIFANVKLILQKIW